MQIQPGILVAWDTNNFFANFIVKEISWSDGDDTNGYRTWKTWESNMTG